jgi:hypothetical protein
MVTKSRVDINIESEKNRAAVMRALKYTAMTRNEVESIVGTSKMQTHNLLKKLCQQGYLKFANLRAYCTVSHRHICSYIATSKEYVEKDMTKIKERADKNKAKRELREAQGPREPKPNPVREARPNKVEPAVVKVNEYTTMYFNSRRPQSDFKMKKEEKSRRNDKVSIGSGMGMFGNW